MHEKPCLIPILIFSCSSTEINAQDTHNELQHTFSLNNICQYIYLDSPLIWSCESLWVKSRCLDKICVYAKWSVSALFISKFFHSCRIYLEIYVWSWECVLTLPLLNMTCPVIANSLDPDQLASEEANWSGSKLFVIRYVNFYQKPR